MRKLIILPSIALACVASMVASPRQALIPGFGRSAIERQKVSRINPQTTFEKRHALPKNIVSAPERKEVGESEAEIRKVWCLLGYDAKLGNTQYSVKRDYDEHGFPAKETYDNGNVCIYDYTWVNPGNVWSARTISTYNGTSLVNKESDERTFHSNGKVASQTVKNMEGSSMYYEYNPDGYLVLSQNVNEGTIERWTIIPGCRLWVYTREDPSYREVLTLDGDYGYVIDFQYLEENVWKTQRKEGHWFTKYQTENGYMSVYYDMNSQGVWGPVDAGGNRTFKIENGSTYEEVTEQIELDIENSSYKWVPIEKTVYSSNYGKIWEYAEGQVRTSNSYRYENNQWTKTYECTYSWVNRKVVKEISVDYVYNDPVSVRYYMPKQYGYSLGDDIYYDESTGNYAIYTSDDDYDYYTYYDAKGNVVSRYREKNDYSDYHISEWTVWYGNDWVKCTGSHTIYQDSDDHYVIKFDDMGRPVVVEEYEEGIIDGRVEYEYTADGYIRKDYVPSYQGPVVLDSVTEFTSDANGVTVEKYTEYDLDGNVSRRQGQKYDPTTGIHYNLQYAEGQWVETPSWVDEIIETLADGTQVRIDRVIDENGNIVNVGKEVSLINKTYELHERYSWNAELNMWIGDVKIERGRTDTSWRLLWAPSDPKVYYDEYFKPVSREIEEEEPRPNEIWYDASYQWDYENNTGWICFQELPEFTYPDDKTKIKVTRNINETVTEKWTTSNPYGRLGGYFVEHADPAGQILSKASHTWEFNDNSNLVKDTETRSDGEVWSYTYRYGNIDVVGIEDIMVSGQDKPFDVYNLQGICVLRNADPDALRTLPRGIYIANGRKIAVR